MVLVTNWRQICHLFEITGEMRTILGMKNGEHMRGNADVCWGN